MKNQLSERPTQRKQTNDPQQSIQERAYQFYQQRGQEPGHELEDWLRAENEVRQQQQQQR